MKSVRTLASLVVVACMTAVTGVLAEAPAALAEPAHTYAATISPGWIASGSSSTLTLALKNTSHSTSAIQSANIVPPPGFTLSRATLIEGERGHAEVEGNVLKLRNIFVPRGATLVVVLTATAPRGCSDSSDQWTSTAKARPNFTGDVFSFVSRTSTLTTTVACALKFTTEPNNAAVGQAITGTAFDPMGSPIAVVILDAAGNPVPSATAPVTIALGNNPGGATLGGTTTQNAVNGVATFSNLTLDQPGDGYTLVGSGSGLGSTTSTPFDEQGTMANCPQDESCSTTLSTRFSTLTVTANPTAGSANAGTLTEAVDVGTPLTCRDHRPSSPDWYEFDVSSINRSKVLTWTVKNSTPEGFQVCFGAPYGFQAFSPDTGGVGPARPGTLPDGTEGFVGLLPSCDAIEASGPCVSSLTSQGDDSSTTGVDTIATVTIPAGLPGDPFIGH